MTAPKVAERPTVLQYENIDVLRKQKQNGATSPSNEHVDDKPPAKPKRIISNNLSRPTSTYVVSTSPPNPSHGVLGGGGGSGQGKEDRRPSAPVFLSLSKMSNGKGQVKNRLPVSVANFNTKDVSPKTSPVGAPPRIKPKLK